MIFFADGKIGSSNFAPAKKYMSHIRTRPAMTTAWGRLVVTFKGDLEVDLSTSEIYECLKQVYDIGYVGLFVDDDCKHVFLQTCDLRKRMTPNKVAKMCSRFGNVTSVEKFSGIHGICMEEIGTFRKAGRVPGSKGAHKPRGSARAPKGGVVNIDNRNIDNTTNNTNNTTNIDNRVTNNNTIHLHVHALGEETIDHIKLEDFKALMGEKEDILETIKEQLPGVCHYVVSREWEKVKHRLYKKHVKAKARAADPDMESEDDSSDDEGDGAGGIYIPPEMSIGGEEPTYDRINEDEQFNSDLKSMVEEFTLLQEDAKFRCLDVPREVAKLMYENPQNCNVIAATKDGYMSFFDGKTWEKVHVDHMTTVLENWEKKFKETVELLKRREGPKMTQSFQGQFSEEIISKFDEPVTIEAKTYRRLQAYQKSQALVALDNVNSKFKEVKKATGKRVERGSDAAKDAKQRKFDRAATWAKLLAM